MRIPQRLSEPQAATVGFMIFYRLCGNFKPDSDKSRAFRNEGKRGPIHNTNPSLVISEQRRFMKNPRATPNNMSRTIAILILLSVSIVLAAPAIGETPKARRPNIVLLVADDQGYAEMSCQGGDIP